MSIKNITFTVSNNNNNIMKALRQVGQFSLNQGNLMAKGLFNMTNTILTENTKDEGVSYWFDSDTKDLLMSCSDAEFISRAKQLAGNNINELLLNLKKELKEAKESGISSWIDEVSRKLDKLGL